MNYRLQDFIKYIIPGLYVIFFVFIWSVLSSNCHIETAKLKDFTSIIFLLIPFVGFVIGYLKCGDVCRTSILYFREGVGDPLKLFWKENVKIIFDI